jgi:ferric-dicitrate binding protein FerR (iron transport regulator)
MPQPAVLSVASYVLRIRIRLTSPAMTDRSRDFQKEWKDANDRVRRAEERLGAAWTAFAAGHSPPPGKDLMDEVAGLRRECDKRLAALLERFGTQGQATNEHPDLK